GDRLRHAERAVVAGRLVLAQGRLLAEVRRGALAVHGQLALLEPDVHVLRLHARQVREHQELVLGLQHVHPRGERHRPGLLLRQLPLVGILRRKVRHGYSSKILSVCIGCRDYSPSLTSILRGLAASCLGKLSRSTPCSYFASTRSASTRAGSPSTRVNRPTGRSWRTHTAPMISGAFRSPWMVNWLPSVTVTSNFAGSTSGRSASTNTAFSSSHTFSSGTAPAALVVPKYGPPRPNSRANSSCTAFTSFHNAPNGLRTRFMTNLLVGICRGVSLASPSS